MKYLILPAKISPSIIYLLCGEYVKDIVLIVQGYYIENHFSIRRSEKSSTSYAYIVAFNAFSKASSDGAFVKKVRLAATIMISPAIE